MQFKCTHTFFVFLFNDVLALLVSCLLILLSILLYLLRCRRLVRLNVLLTQLFTVEFRVTIDNFLECRAKPVVLVVVVQEGVVAEELRAEAVRLHAEMPQGMQKLLNVVQEFTAWCGMQINVKRTYLLQIDNDKKRREQEPAPLLTINGETLKR